MKNPYETAQELASKKLVQTCETYRHLIDVPYEIDTMEGIAYSFEQTMTNAYGNHPDDLCDIMVVQARMLDGLFHRYLSESTEHSARRDHKIESALRMQNQMVRTLNTWKKLKEATFIKYKLVKLHPREKFNTERTGQNDAPLDR